MSKIIKKTDLIMSSPKILKAFNHLEREVTVVQQAELKAGADGLWGAEGGQPDLLGDQRRELEMIKQESVQILAETEELVKELMNKARDEAREVLSRAEDEAGVVRQQAAREAEKLLKNTKEQAYRDGLRQANEAIEADRQMAMEQSRRIMEEAERNKYEIMRSVETDMVRLIIAISKKVIVHELNTRPELIVGIVRDAVANLDNPENMRIYVNPQELEILVDTLATERLLIDGNRDLAVVIKADGGISAGGCVIESDGASVDATAETRISKVEQALIEIPGSEQ